jgi:hypothetical protein
MSWEFGDVDLKAHLHKQADWDQAFVDTHFEKMHGLRGQRKLLLSNMLALTLAVDDMKCRQDTRRIQLVVAGASPGIHLPLIIKHLGASNLRNNIDIHLYDPKRLHKAAASVVCRHEHVTFTQDLFKDSDAQEWSRRDSKKNCLIFLSDIRSDIHGKKEHVRVDEDTIGQDMQMQKTWVERMQPDYSMLKFHARHATPDDASVAPSFRYLKGTLYKQAFTDLFSAECRLFVTKADIGEQEYSTTAIERHMFYHNQTLRPKMYSVCNKGQDTRHLPFDEAFQAHVAEEAARVLDVDSRTLLRDACTELDVDPIVFTWSPTASTHEDTLLRCIQTVL